MQLAKCYETDKLTVSFELFPPKTSRGDEALWCHVEALMKFGPSYVTCTYGAGGSTRDKTLDIVQRIKQKFDIPVASHLTCVAATVDYLREFLSEAKRRKVDHIVALRGDPPKGETEFVPVGGGLRHANELVALIRSEFPDFGIAVAGYPEVHRESPSAEADLANLKRKVATGADVVITQLFYDNEEFFRFRDRYQAAGIDAPLIPGILPITSWHQIQRITGLCGARLPTALVERLKEREDADWQSDVGIEHATRQVESLVESGVPGVHFYVLNRSAATSRVLQSLQSTP
jgi:methylenetetrahydrofolate reductase (NADPH)